MLEKTAGGKITVALAGPPNVGKSTVFNLLTGLSQHVGNWPGKTVEQKSGVLRRGDVAINIVDLPGTYSLTANSLEEQIARDFLVQDKPEVVVAVLNAASLERNLYLVSELIELCPRLVIGSQHDGCGPSARHDNRRGNAVPYTEYTSNSHCCQQEPGS